MSGKHRKRLCQSSMVKHTAWHLLAICSKAFAQLACDSSVQDILKHKSPTQKNAYESLQNALNLYVQGQDGIIKTEKDLIIELSKNMRDLEYAWGELRENTQNQLKNASDLQGKQVLLQGLKDQWEKALNDLEDNDNRFPGAALVSDSCSSLCKGDDDNNICEDQFCENLAVKVIEKKYNIWRTKFNTCPPVLTSDYNFLPGDAEKVKEHCEELAFKGCEKTLDDDSKDEVCWRIYDDASERDESQDKILELSTKLRGSQVRLSDAETAKTACTNFVGPFLAWYEPFKDYEGERRAAKLTFREAQQQFNKAGENLGAAEAELVRLMAQLGPEMTNLREEAEKLKQQIDGTQDELTKLEKRAEKTARLHDSALDVQKAVLNELRSVVLFVFEHIQEPMKRLFEQVQIVKQNTFGKALGTRQIDNHVDALQSKCDDFDKIYTDTESLFEDKTYFHPQLGDEAAEWTSARNEEATGILDICARNVSDKQVYKTYAQELKHLITFRQRGEDGSLGKLVAAVEEYLQEGINKFEKLRPFDQDESDVTDLSALASLAHFAGTYLNAPLASRYLRFWGKDKHLAKMLKMVFDLHASVEKSNQVAKEKLASDRQGLESVKAELEKKQNEVAAMETKTDAEKEQKRKTMEDLQKYWKAFKEIEEKMLDSQIAVAAGNVTMQKAKQNLNTYVLSDTIEQPFAQSDLTQAKEA